MTLIHPPHENEYQPQEWYSELPRQVSRIGMFGIILMLSCLGGFGYWAFSAPLAAAVVSQGSFVATGRNKILQHFEGGIIDQILVSEGDFVKAGDRLVTLDTTAAETHLKELNMRGARLEAMISRFRAEYFGYETLEFPPKLHALAAENLDLSHILTSQTESFTLSRDKLENDLGLLNDNITAQSLRKQGYSDQRHSVQEQIVLFQEDLEAKTTLFDRGLTRKTELNALRRSIVEGTGQIARLGSEMGESDTMIEKYRKQALQTEHAYKEAALDEWNAAQAELDSINEQILQARDVLRRTEITAPVAGTVVRMHYHTSGGVIRAGKEIAEIIPYDAPLIIETLIPRTEIDSVQLGQHAFIRLSALNQRTTPVLDGEVIYVSADSIHNQEDQTNPEVYIARVTLARSSHQQFPGFVPTPGMPAEVLITTQERTFFQYITKPIVDSMSRAFRED
ncbi:HlyD family type I secretion periplasmic adaptor subunit [Epibacterium ulvae]|uniref:HlyD family type I secretion periplasmic adaptor subunit n=1 Tax=Epibacterium ulvae TaxID=1156985 RepID=UPI002491CD05|nr:HlyD family type I secretion periplasmic adaptor subunit [Epibacterium ulvae]